MANVREDKNELNRSAAELLPAFEKVAEQATAYYRAVGDLVHSANHDNDLWRPQSPGLGLDYVPPDAREGLSRMIVAAGLKLRTGNGFQGDNAYFWILKEGATKEKLEALSDLLAIETAQLRRQSNFQNTLDEDKNRSQTRGM